MIVNDTGKVALQHHTTNPASVKISRDGTAYSFVPKHNVCLAWVNQEHVGELLSVKAKICCGKQAQKFVYAPLINVALWMTGERNSENLNLKEI